MNRKKLCTLIKENALLKGEFTLRSGKKSNYYLDKYLFETKPQILKGIAEHLTEMLPDKSQFDLLAGPELGAVAIASAVSIEAKIPFIIVKKEKKGYGTDKMVEGSYKKGNRIILLEDILTTGGQAIKSALLLKDMGLDVLEIIGVIDREEGANEKCREAGLKVRALFTKSDLGI